MGEWIVLQKIQQLPLQILLAYEIGLSDIDVGSNLGWDIDKGYIDLDFSSQLDENGTPCLVVGHHRPPVYIF